MPATNNKYNTAFLEEAHKRSSSHKDEMLAGNLCACFYCEQTFAPQEIEEWFNENRSEGETAICPRCGMDSVLSDKLPITDEQFLHEMNVYWF